MTLDTLLLVLLLVAVLWPVLMMRRRRRAHPAPLGYVRLADRYYRDRRGFSGDE